MKTLSNDEVIELLFKEELTDKEKKLLSHVTELDLYELTLAE